MRWPDETLPLEVEAAFGADVTADPGTWTWTDLSNRLRATPISIRAGASSSDGLVAPGTCTVTLANDDAALTPLHPMSPHWPNVELGTPMRVRLRRIADTFARTTVGNSWGSTPDGEQWSVGGTGASVFAGVGRHSHSDVGNVRVSTLPVSLTDTEQVADIAPSALLTGSALVTGFVFRHVGGQQFYWLRCEFNAGGTAVALKITRYTTAGGYVDLATLSPVPGLTYAANGYLRVRASVVGTRMAIKAWPAAGTEPAGWQLTATDSVVTAPGKVGFQSWLVSGNSNALPVVAQHKSYTVYVDRFSGHADQWEPTYLPTGVVGQMSSAMRITASGILRRLQQGSPPSLSPMRRTIAASNPAAYWPAEDGVAATQAGSAIPGQPPLSVVGDVKFAPVEDFTTVLGLTLRFGTSALVDLAGGGTIAADVSPEVTAATATRWTVMVAAAADVTIASDDIVVTEISTTGGTFAKWQFVHRKATLRMQVMAVPAVGSPVLVVDDVGVYTTFQQYDVSVWQSGGTIQAGIGWGGGSFTATGSVAGTLAGVTRIAVNPTRSTQSVQMPVGHVTVWPTGNVPAPVDRGFADPYGWTVYGALLSYDAETATDRLTRLCAEDGVPLDIPAVGADGIQRMGWQPFATSVNLFRECEQADIGVLHERQFGLAYTPRVYRYNQPVDLTIDLATYAVSEKARVDPLAPVYDDQDLRNQWTVERTEGSFAVAVDAASQRRGSYPDKVELNLFTDAQLPGQASWRLHLTSDPDLRESSFPIDLTANPGLVDGWLSCQVGSRIVRTNPPAQHRPGPLDRLVMGWTETIGPRTWQVQVVPAQAGSWDVGVYDGTSRYDTTGSELTAPFTAGTDTVMSVLGPNWSDANLPLDIECGGAQLRVTGIAGSLPQAFTVNLDPVNGVAKTIPAGTAVRLWQPAVYAL